MADTTLKTPAAAIRDFRERHQIDQEEMDRLLGFSSKGRATRRWEAEDAPYYVSILMAYADVHGLDLMRKLADAREQAPA